MIPVLQKMVKEPHKGEYKKQVLIQTLTRIVTDSQLTDETKIQMNLLIQTTVSPTIDAMVGIAHGTINLAKKHIENGGGCCVIG